jgi:hypothetical protein
VYPEQWERLQNPNERDDSQNHVPDVLQEIVRDHALHKEKEQREDRETD